MVVDNGSSDGSVGSVAREFPDVELRAARREPPLRRRQQRGPPPRARATATTRSCCSTTTPRPTPDCFEHLLLALEQDPAAGAAAPLIYFARAEPAIWYAGGRCIPALGLHRRIADCAQLDRRPVPAPSRTTGYLTGCCLLARREAWERVGLLDERYFIYAEDADWCLRARAAGVRLLFVPTARLWHKVSASAGAASPWKIYQRLRANLRLFARHARGIGARDLAARVRGAAGGARAWLLARGQRGGGARGAARASGRSARRRPPAGGAAVTRTLERAPVETGARARRAAAVPPRDHRRRAPRARACSTRAAVPARGTTTSGPICRSSAST